MVDVQQACGTRNRVFRYGLEARKKRPTVAAALHEGMNRIAIGCDRGDARLPCAVPQSLGFADARCATPGSLAPGAFRIVYPPCDIPTAIALPPGGFRG